MVLPFGETLYTILHPNHGHAPMRPLSVIAVASLILPLRLSAQDTVVVRRPPAAFTGFVGSMQTGQPVSVADIRLVYVDSARVAGTTAVSINDVFVDSARSHAAMTDDSGHFAMRGVAAGHYLIQVRRIGFAPFEGLLTIDTATVDMELALDQQVTMLPRVTVTSSSLDRVTTKLNNVGFLSRSRMGTSGKFIDRASILQQRATYVTDVLEKYGIGPDANIIIDRMESDWDNLRDYPLDLVIGIEIYNRRGSLPTEFDHTSSGNLAFGQVDGASVSRPAPMQVGQSLRINPRRGRTAAESRKRRSSSGHTFPRA